jgi:hypothetical protein
MTILVKCELLYQEMYFKSTIQFLVELKWAFHNKIMYAVRVVSLLNISKICRNKSIMKQRLTRKCGIRQT